MELDSRPWTVAGSSEGPEVFVVSGSPPTVYNVQVPVTGAPPAPQFTLDFAEEVVGAAHLDGVLYVATEEPMDQGGILALQGNAAEEVSTGSSGFTPVAVAKGLSRVGVLIGADDGRNKLVLLARASPTTEVVPPSCGGARYLHANPIADLFVVTCSEGQDGLWVYDAAVGTNVNVPLPRAFPFAALDQKGDVVLAWDPDAGVLLVVSVVRAKVLAEWEVEPSAFLEPLFAHPGSARFLASGPGAGQITVIAPYQRSAPCVLE